MTPDLVDFVTQRDELAALDPAERRLALRRLLSENFGSETISVAGEIADLIDGYGPLTGAMRDPEVTDIMVNGPDEIWVERRGYLERTGLTFSHSEVLAAFVERLFASAGGRLDMSSPVADARLSDGSRIHAVLPPLAARGPLLSIRKFPVDAFSLVDLAGFGMFSETQLGQLRDAVRDRRTVAISGGTGTGKTTLLNALLGEIPASERVILIEETPELRPCCPHHVSLIARGTNIEGKGGVDLRQLLRAALRMRPDRIVVGEVRGPEALVALDAMSTGHEGSFVTVHARSSSEVLERMVALALQGGGPSESSLRTRFTHAFDVSVHLIRRQGRRVVASIEQIS